MNKLMTKKHFETFAAALAKIRPEPVIDCAPATAVEKMRRNDRTEWQISVNLIADVCAESNPRFDRERFMAACEE